MRSLAVRRLKKHPQWLAPLAARSLWPASTTASFGKPPGWPRQPLAVHLGKPERDRAPPVKSTHIKIHGRWPFTSTCAVTAIPRSSCDGRWPTPTVALPARAGTSTCAASCRSSRRSGRQPVPERPHPVPLAALPVGAAAEVAEGAAAVADQRPRTGPGKRGPERAEAVALGRQNAVAGRTEAARREPVIARGSRAAGRPGSYRCHRYVLRLSPSPGSRIECSGPSAAARPGGRRVSGAHGGRALCSVPW
jgi:hypothetical protein